jgi:hypothetical protein
VLPTAVTPEKALEDFMWDMRRYHPNRGIAAISDGVLKVMDSAPTAQHVMGGAGD